MFSVGEVKKGSWGHSWTCWAKRSLSFAPYPPSGPCLGFVLFSFCTFYPWYLLAVSSQYIPFLHCLAGTVKVIEHNTEQFIPLNCALRNG
jgi:hypothetical protein